MFPEIAGQSLDYTALWEDLAHMDILLYHFLTFEGKCVTIIFDPFVIEKCNAIVLEV